MVEILLAAALLMPGATPDACDLDCERLIAVRLLESGETRAAVDSLKRACERFPEDRQLVLLLARSYLLSYNLFWAE